LDISQDELDVRYQIINGRLASIDERPQGVARIIYCPPHIVWLTQHGGFLLKKPSQQHSIQIDELRISLAKAVPQDLSRCPGILKPLRTVLAAA
jgi:hypothetical protein